MFVLLVHYAAAHKTKIVQLLQKNVLHQKRIQTVVGHVIWKSSHVDSLKLTEQTGLVKVTCMKCTQVLMSCLYIINATVFRIQY